MSSEQDTKPGNGQGAIAGANPPSADEVAEFLKANPDYLHERPELLSVLSPPSRWTEADGSVVDMQAFMLDRLKSESENLRQAANELVTTTRSNMLVQTRTHAAVLGLLASDGFERLVHVIRFDLPLLLDVDAVSLCFESADGSEPLFATGDVRQVPPGTLDHLLETPDTEAMLFADTGDDGTVFGEAAGLIASAAIARIRPTRTLPQGLLALGGRHTGTFDPSQGTELLTFLARVTEHCVHRWLPRNA